MQQQAQLTPQAKPIASALSVRKATQEDIPAIVEMGARFHAESPYAEAVPYDRVSLALTVAALGLGEKPWNANGVAFLLTDGEIDGGVIVAVRYPFWFNREEIGVTEIMWWVDPEHRGQGIKLLRVLESWSEAAGAKMLTMVTLPERKGVARIYDRLGFSPHESSYIKAL